MYRGIRGSVVAVVLLVAAAAAAAALAADPPATGEPPAGCICEQGQRQSPIDLAGAAPAELPAIRFRYGETVGAEVFDTGKTVEVEFAAGRRPWIAIRGERFGDVFANKHYYDWMNQPDVAVNPPAPACPAGSGSGGD